MKNKLYVYRSYFFVFSFLLVLFTVICTGNEIQSVTTYNSNSTKSIQAMHFVNISDEESTSSLFYNNLEEVSQAMVATNQPASIHGKVTGYGPDCKGCSGNVACPPGKNVTGGNIYYSDATYGNVRIVAADRSVPCGTIVQLNEIGKSKENIIAIVLDRGNSIKNNHIDLLFESEHNMNGYRTQSNIKIDFLRWGW